MKVTDYFQPYAEFYFMDDRTDQAVAPAAAFFGANPFDPTQTGSYPVNCNNPFLSAQQQSTLCTPAQIAAANANPTARLYLGGGGRLSANCVGSRDRTAQRRRRAPGNRISSTRIIARCSGSKGDLIDSGALTYDVYGQYYYTTFTNNNQLLQFSGHRQCLRCVQQRRTPTCVSGPPCVPYNIFKDGGVTQAALNYLYINGLSIGASTLRTEHGELTGAARHLGHHLAARPRWGGDQRGIRTSQRPRVLPAGLCRGESAAVRLWQRRGAHRRSLSVTEGFTEIRAPLIQDMPGAKELLFDTGYRYSSYQQRQRVDTIGFEAHTYKFEVQYAPIAGCAIARWAMTRPFVRRASSSCTTRSSSG